MRFVLGVVIFAIKGMIRQDASFWAIGENVNVRRDTLEQQLTNVFHARMDVKFAHLTVFANATMTMIVNATVMMVVNALKDITLRMVNA
jgi:hypothetical protein